MCCNNANEQYTEELRRKMIADGGTSTLFKSLDSFGVSTVAKFQYEPGTFVEDIKPGQYDPNKPRGFHVYLRPINPSPGSGDIPIKAICHVDDLICANSTEAVFSKITISQEAWEEFEEAELNSLDNFLLDTLGDYE